MMMYVPLFPLAMIAGLIIQKIVMRLSLHNHVSRVKISNLSNIALDLLIISALGSLSLKTLTQNWEILVVLALGGVLYNTMTYFIMSRKIFGRSWRIQGLGELGQSMGTTAIGLLLLKRAGKSAEKYIDSFSYKQPLYEPIVGGGFVTALSLPIINQFGPWYFLGFMTISTFLLLERVYMFIRRSEQGGKISWALTEYASGTKGRAWLSGNSGTIQVRLTTIPRLSTYNPLAEIFISCITLF
jgi:ESS family glutamate:Na+ symporter